MTRDDDDLVFNFDQKDDGNDYDDGQPAVDQDIQDQQEDDSHTTDGYFFGANENQHQRRQRRRRFIPGILID